MSDGAFFFGCWRETGHYLYFPSGSYTCGEQRLPVDFPVNPQSLDSGLLPPRQPEAQGRSTLAHINGWTIISFWDRSGDPRPKSNSSFLFRGKYTFDVVKNLIASEFPELSRRFPFQIFVEASQ